MAAEQSYVSNVKTLSLLLISDHRIDEKGDLIHSIVEKIIKDEEFRSDPKLKPEAVKAIEVVHKLCDANGSLNKHFKTIRDLVMKTRNHLLEVYPHSNIY